MITTKDLSHALSRLGYSSVSDDTITEILQEVDFDRKGSINFEDFIEIAAGLKGASFPCSITAPKTAADLCTSPSAELSLHSAFSHIAMQDDASQEHLAEPITTLRSGGGL